MCGTFGFWDPTSQISQPQSVINDGVKRIHHRGPDSQDSWSQTSTGIHLGHARLAILDLSPHGKQPMTSHSERYVIVYNGEIYNHLELRKTHQLENQAPFQGHSDTETLLHLIEKIGLQKTLEQTQGMFAFALWDKKQNTLTLSRDRMGEKPLYYGFINNTFVFGSELKSFKSIPNHNLSINNQSLSLYLKFGYVPSPHSILNGIHKLEPGTVKTISYNNTWSENTQSYWNIDHIAQTQSQTLYTDDTKAINDLESLLTQVIQNQMISDVPLGAFLSGGVDSSAIVALMQKINSQKTNTFSIGFDNAEYNEANHAKAVAKHLGTNHHELYVSAKDALDVIPLLPQIYCEPFSDVSQIPTYLVSQMAKQHVTVSLSGDAGDEIFGGYNRYTWGPKILNKTKALPHVLKSLGSRSITSLSPKSWDQLFKALAFALPKSLRYKSPGNHLHKLARVLPSQNLSELYDQLVTQWPCPQNILLSQTKPKSLNLILNSTMDAVSQMILADQKSYLPDDILAKVDRAAMAVSLETRVPFLDPRVVEFGWRLPNHMKIRNGSSKWTLRQVLYKHVPQSLIERPKMGFGVPIDHWLRHEIKDWAYELINESTLKNQNLFDPKPVLKRWNEHQSQKHNWQHSLWTLLMFQAWQQDFFK